MFMGSDPIQIRIMDIEKNHIDMWRNAWHPILWSLTFSFLYPYISVLPFAAARHAHSIKQKLRNKLEEIATISIEKYVDLRQKMIEQKNGIQELVEKRGNRENALEVELTNLSEELEKSHIELDRLQIRKNYGLGKVGYQTLKNDIEATLSDLDKQVSSSFTNGLAELGDKVHKELNSAHVYNRYFTLMSAWLNRVKYRVRIEELHGTTDDIDDLVLELLHTAEAMKADIRAPIINSQAHTKAEIRKLTDIKENWNAVSQTINELVSRWKGIEKKSSGEIKKEHSYDYYKKLSRLDEVIK